MKRNWKDWAVKALIRAVKTFAQTMVSMIAVGAAFSEVDWLRALSVSGVAFVLSWLILSPASRKKSRWRSKRTKSSRLMRTHDF